MEILARFRWSTTFRRIGWTVALGAGGVSPYINSKGDSAALLPVCIGFVCGMLISSWWSIVTVPALYSIGFLIVAIISLLPHDASWNNALEFHVGWIAFPLFIYALDLASMFVPVVVGTLVGLGIQRARS